MSTRQSVKRRKVEQQTRSCGSDYANVGMSAPVCGGFTAQQPSDLA